MTHLLFFDEFYFVDDYKVGFRELRREQFPFLRPVRGDDAAYLEAERLSVELTKGLMLDIRAGQLTPGLITDFITSMGLHLTAAWQMRSSDFFLTLKILADEPDSAGARYKYSPLTALIFQQVCQAPILGPTHKLISRDGEMIPDHREIGKNVEVVGDELKRFSQSLNWLVRRAGFYALYCARAGVAACLHPIRHSFVARWAPDALGLSTSQAWLAKTNEFFGVNAAKAVNDINSSTEALEVGLDLPLFAAWSVGRAGSVSDALSFILDIRQSKEVKGIRERFAEISALQREGNTERFKIQLNRVRTAIQAETIHLMKLHGPAVRTRPTVSIEAGLDGVPKVSAEAEIPIDLISRRFGKNRYFRTFFNNVVGDVVGFDNLGGVRYAMLRQVVRSEDASIPALRIEERRYVRSESHWKRPM